ncbi:Hypothetical predicted protein [Cloeon dipterum]|uniref:Peptidase S1 domain-containing protein n=1 Tax=Cloeon dipterum TaxID=197152 RepID=A0A8S1D8C6_9INSE|nr:Hypothetical predicted protein [Cloeon dipterum]
MRSCLAIVLLVLLAQASARATDESKNEAEAQFERPTIKEYTLEELLGEDNVTGIAALQAANEKRDKITEAGSATTVVKKGARILGGTTVTSGQHSYNVIVGALPYSGNVIYCGGALLSPQWVLTAAQCVAGASLIVVYAGAVSISQQTIVLKNARATIHPGFVRNFALNDIALLKTATPYTLGSTISTIRLSTASVASVENAQLRTFGFGAENNDLALGGTLKYVDMSNLKKSTCLTLTADFYVAYPGNTGCLSTSVATKGWCYGDTGSPVVYTNDGDSTTKVYGINSQYLGCSSAYPSSYTLAADQSKNESEKVEDQFEESGIKEYTLEELLGEDNVTGIAALEAANEKREKIKEEESATTVVKDGARILGGTAVTEGQHAYNVLVVTVPFSGSDITCGGALLSTQWVLTAAQCVAGASSITVFAGAVSTPADSGTSKSATAKIHPKFVRNFALNDIALLKTATAYTLGSTISTIKLSTASTGTMENAQLRTFGFGPENNDAAIGETLNFVDMSNVKKATCLSLTADFFVVYPANTGCLSTSIATKGWCFGDTGSPVVYINEEDSSTKIYGINSQFLGCSSSYPSSYTLVGPYIAWIKATTKLIVT